MSERLPTSEFEPEQTLALAASMAERGMREEAWERSLLVGSIPLPPIPPTEIQKSIKMGVTVAMLKMLENPDTPINMVDTMHSVFDDTTLADLVRSYNEEPTEENKLTTRSLIDAQIRAVQEHVIHDQSIQERMKNQLQAAALVAHNHSKDINEVFASDDLYAECMRTMYTPESYAQEVMSMIEKTNQEFILTYVENIVASELQAGIDSGEISSEDYELEKAEIMEMVREDQETMVELDQLVETIRQAYEKVMTRGIERFWGESDVHNTSTILGRLAIQPAEEVTLSAGMLRLQSYNDIVATVCMEKGWDPNNLTVEQMRYIHSTSEIEDF